MVYGNQSSDICYSSAVNVCGNCGQACDELIDLPSWNFKACATCAEETAQEDARENCEHLNVRVEEGANVNDEYVTYFEDITCCDCGAELRENRKGELVPLHGRTK